MHRDGAQVGHDEIGACLQRGSVIRRETDPEPRRAVVKSEKDGFHDGREGARLLEGEQRFARRVLLQHDHFTAHQVDAGIRVGAHCSGSDGIPASLGHAREAAFGVTQVRFRAEIEAGHVGRTLHAPRVGAMRPCPHYSVARSSLLRSAVTNSWRARGS